MRHANRIFLSFSLSYSDILFLFIVVLEGHCCIWSHSMTHTRQDSSGRRIGPSQKPVSNNTNVDNRQTAMSLGEFETAISAFERPRTYDITPRNHRHRLCCVLSAQHCVFWLCPDFSTLSKKTARLLEKHCWALNVISLLLHRAFWRFTNY
jgi:hypothetical protein